MSNGFVGTWKTSYKFLADENATEYATGTAEMTIKDTGETYYTYEDHYPNGDVETGDGRLFGGFINGNGTYTGQYKEPADGDNYNTGPFTYLLYPGDNHFYGYFRFTTRPEMHWPWTGEKIP